MKILLLVSLALLAGCGSLKPDYVTAGYTHQSQPFKGPGPAPFGDNDRSSETSRDAVELGLQWYRGPVYFDATVGYAPWYHNIGAGPWMTTFRVGARFKLP